MTETTERVQSAIDALALSMTAVFIPWDGKGNPTLNWTVTLLKEGKPVLTTPYSAGCGHCPSYVGAEYGKRQTAHVRAAVEWECRNGRKARHLETLDHWCGQGKPLLPTLADVLYSLLSDGGAIDCANFDEWASDLGYDTDSRKAERIYRACLETGLALRAALGDSGLSALRTAFRDY